MTLLEMKTLYRKAQTAYYNGKPIMSDQEFDKLEDKIRARSPNWAGFKTPGSETVVKKRKVELEFPMPSLSKAYPHQIDKWLKIRKGPMLVMSKLDGSSIQVNYRVGRLLSVITRGNGTIGQDITFLSRYLNLPRTLPIKKDVGIRFEAIMAKDIFDKKYADQAENPRNLVAGLLNRKLKDGQQDALKDIHFVALGVYGQPMIKGLMLATKWGFETVDCEVRAKRVDGPYLEQLLRDWRAASDYEMDGLVLCPSDQPMIYEDSGVPDWATAFKINAEEEAPETEVEEVIWQISHARRWTPKIKIKPVRLSGATISYVTVHNAKWMADRKIGPGAIVKIVRSGDVIPKIVGVVKPAKTLVMPDGEVEWRGRYLYAVGQSEEAAAKNITRFLTVCGIEGVKLKTVEKMKFQDIESLVEFTSLPRPRQVKSLTLLGFGPKQTEIIIRELQGLQQGVDLVKVMVGSGVFQMGIGERRLNALAQAFPLQHLLTDTKAELREKVLAVPGFKDKTFNELAAGLPKFRALYKKIAKHMRVIVPKTVKENKASIVDGPLKGAGATWTGYRSKEEEQQWLSEGGTIVPFGTKTKVLFYKEGGKRSSKIEKAMATGTQVRLWADRHKIKM